jgi:hypothetical protein
VQESGLLHITFTDEGPLGLKLSPGQHSRGHMVFCGMAAKSQPRGAGSYSCDATPRGPAPVGCTVGPPRKPQSLHPELVRMSVLRTIGGRYSCDDRTYQEVLSELRSRSERPLTLGFSPPADGTDSPTGGDGGRIFEVTFKEPGLLGLILEPGELAVGGLHIIPIRGF